MSDVRIHFLLFLPLGVSLALAGCKAQNNPTDEQTPPPRGSTTQPAARSRAPRDPRSPLEMDERQLTLPQSSVAVAQGPTPLVYIFDQPASIRVIDLTTGGQLAAVNVQGRTLVRVDDRNGVTVGSDNVAPGKLTPGHNYAIYSDPTTPNTISHGVGRPVDVPKATPAQKR